MRGNASRHLICRYFLLLVQGRSSLSLSLFNSRMLNFELNQKRDRGEGDLLLCLVIALRTRLGGDGDA